VAQPNLVCDTSVLLYLGRIDHLFLLPRLFAEIAIPVNVAFELDVGRSIRAETIDARQLEWATLVTITTAQASALPANRLGAGESAVLAWALAYRGWWAALDDAQARHFANQLGVIVVGTVGLLIQAKRVGLIPEIGPRLTAVIAAGLRLSPELCSEVLRLAGEAS
jgi:predicted nucleic acid-binding protein